MADGKSGMDRMFEAAIKLILARIDLDPEIVKGHVANIVQIMAEHERTQQRILADLAAIKLHFGIKEPESDERQIAGNGGQPENLDGTGDGAGKQTGDLKRLN